MPTIEISDESLEKIKDQLGINEFEVVDINKLDDLVGKKLFIRTVTYHYTGKVESIIGNVIELSNASWIADSGRFSDAINEGELDEIEPIGQWFINFNSITDFGIWKHKLPTKQK